jgi:hypothetical protein
MAWFTTQSCQTWVALRVTTYEDSWLIGFHPSKCAWHLCAPGLVAVPRLPNTVFQFYLHMFIPVGLWVCCTLKKNNILEKRQAFTMCTIRFLSQNTSHLSRGPGVHVPSGVIKDSLGKIPRLFPWMMFPLNHPAIGYFLASLAKFDHQMVKTYTHWLSCS